jgi:D-tyrosyl-tRNA(Tyr) deacylase
VKTLLQRVSRASVLVDGEVVGSIGPGLLIFLGVERDDGPEDVDYMAAKTTALRLFPDRSGKMNNSLLDSGGSALVISQFTLAADTRRGRRPSFSAAARPELAETLYRRYVDRIRAEGVPVETGVFQAMMEVRLVNDGPVTILLDPRPDRATR